MKKLSYETLRELGYQGYLKERAPERVLQFGEGNFLRAFVDHFLDVANEEGTFDGKAVLVQPIEAGLADLINSQQGLYTLYLRGRKEGRRVDERRVISSVSRCIDPYRDFDAFLALARNADLEFIVSNTTEAGIVFDGDCQFADRPPASFPGKLTRFLYERYLAFSGARDKAVIILACELIDDNGRELKKCVEQYTALWGLERAFSAWLEGCVFCGTLVDRIVPGRVKDPARAAAMEQENGYRDALADVGECFGVWVIEGPAWLEQKLPFQKAGLNVLVVPDVAPYKKRKVRILNGAHTALVLGAYLAGFNIVRDCMRDEVMRGFMNKVLYDEVIPTLDLPREDLLSFAAAVEDRFNNPFVDHELLSISLNSTAKWRARCLPSLTGYVQGLGRLPGCLVMSLAAYIAFYSGGILRQEQGALVCRRPQGEEYRVVDDPWVLDFFFRHRDVSEEVLVRDVLKNERMWGQDLSAIQGLEAEVLDDVRLIREKGARASFASCL